MTLDESRRIRPVSGTLEGDRTAFDARVSSYLAGRTPDTSLINRLGREIVGGIYTPESLLPAEAAMLDRYAVSRTALREAYSKLTAKGLLTARPKVGTSILPKTYWNMLDGDVLNWHLQTFPPELIAADLFALRRMIEPGAAELAAARNTPDDLVRIGDALTAMEGNADDEVKLIEADLRFHLSILKATQNKFINTFSALIHAAMTSTFSISWRGASRDKATRLHQHAMVAEAIRDRDPGLARHRMEVLLDDSFRDVKEGLALR